MGEWLGVQVARIVIGLILGFILAGILAACHVVFPVWGSLLIGVAAVYGVWVLVIDSDGVDW